jgi:hypothetical protein
MTPVSVLVREFCIFTGLKIFEYEDCFS